ncbi:SusD/RagB family nutrient-binding outer membrane lipoprotein [Gracilimonas halophila]|uniref:SusD/RagB family nutrient-binding outer membrane lipoprotein n=1 Tax=Gracilimonas halophila TaxID=1834464 RepID=A0ABW5JIJ7_9BACT
MKIFSKQILIFCITTVFFLTGCEGFLDINDDPNNPTEAPPQGLMTNVTYETAQNMYRMGSITSYYVQYLASPNQASATDVHEAVSYGNQWYRLYDVMTDLTDLEVLAEEEGATQYVGIAKILKALNLATLVDAWGDAPYSQAFYAETLNPEYDSQENLYNEVFTLLEDGLTELQAGNSTIVAGNEDFIYGGDITRWERLAYMLQARYLNHYSKQASYVPDAVLAALDNGFQSNADDAQVTYYEEEVNPWASVAIANAGLILGGWMSEQIVDHMNGTTYGVIDPRIETFMSTNDDDDYVGVTNGAGRGNAPEQGAFSVLTTDDFYSAQTAPVVIASYAEQKFIEAEAALRATPSQTTRAYQAYMDGIEAHMDKVGVAEADKQLYMNNPVVDVGELNLTIDHIMKEKYVAMFLHPESWVDARRHDYSYNDMIPPANSALGGDWVRRFIYPESETQRNGENVPSITQTDNLFWDQ